jgi:organic radical activating enzyme
MSNYNQAADTAEKQLKHISKTMCYAKWAQASIHLTNGMTHSCYHPPLHKINIDDIKKNPSALHNTEQKKSERNMMLKGERPDGCSYCWRIEDAGARSDRIYRSGEYWAQNARKDIIETLDTGDVDPRYLEVNFNQACNFKCMYCSPHLSTEWENEVEKFGPYNILARNGDDVQHNALEYLNMPLKIKQGDNPYVEAFWQWWPQLYKKLEVFRMTGGEPLMDANTFKVLDYIYENPNAWLEVSVTTNMCPPKQELMDKFINKVKKLEEIQIWEDKERFNPGAGNHWYVNMAVKNFALFVSVDSIDEQAEYIRSGLNFQSMKDNVLNFLSNTSNTTVTFINTFNILSVPKIKNYLEYILDLRKEFSKDAQGIKYIPIHDPYHKHPDYEIHPRQRIWFDVPLLRSPDWQNVQLLPASFDRYLEEAIDFMKANNNTDNFVGFYDFEIAKLERNLSIMKERITLDPSKVELDKKNFVSYFDQYDARKDLSLVDVFPELKEFYQECKLL